MNCITNIDLGVLRFRLLHYALFYDVLTELINYTQPVYVWREDPNSRQNTIKEIIERATSKEDWPQVAVIKIVPLLKISL